MRIIFLLPMVVLLAGGCDKSAETPSTVSPAPDPPTVLVQDSTTTGTLSTVGAIRAALPFDLATDEQCDQILKWHRQAMRPLVLEPQAVALRSLERGDLLGVVSGMKDYSSAEQVGEAQGRVRQVAEGYRLALGLMTIRMQEERDRFSAVTGGNREAMALFERMPVYQLAETERQRMESSLRMCASLDAALGVIGDSMGRARTVAESQALRGHLEEFQREYRLQRSAGAE